MKYFLILITFHLTLFSSALIHAIDNNDTAAVSQILKSGHDPFKVRKRKQKPNISLDCAFNYACRVSNIQVIEVFLPYVDNVNKWCKGMTPLLDGVVGGDINIVKVLIQKGVLEIPCQSARIR